MKTFKVYINTGAAGNLNAQKRILLAPGESDRITSAAKTAGKMIRACRENVLFLNQQLHCFEKYLGYPPVIDNVLYLAYTLEVKEKAPFTPAQLRQHLRNKGVESAAEFRFLSESNIDSVASDAPASGGPETAKNINRFCIPCHLGLTILDLQQIVKAFRSFFETIKNSKPIYSSYGS